MNKVSVVVFAAVCGGAVGWLLLHERDESPRPWAVAADGGLDGQAVALPEGQPNLEAGAGGAAAGGDGVAGGGTTDGGDMPSLGDGPKSVKFGAVLVQYAGAQGAKGDVRSRAEAQKLADELAVLAREDFAAAVKKGDRGSVEDAGRMFRGILEKGPEYTLFNLDEGAVSEPVDTPRGFWILKRLD
ncbi:MAG: peptidylprolyl isomerase [Deltaproteobacteria bacterium]|nr:peptidylprolyl isomerase [Deltaproteobacteria bacterium]